MPTSSGKGERDLLIQQSNTSFSLHTFHEGFTSLFIAREFEGFRKQQLDSTLIQKRRLNPNRRSSCLSADQTVDRPIPSADRLVNRTQQRVGHASRSTVLVDYSPCYGRPGGRPSCACARCAHLSRTPTNT